MFRLSIWLIFGALALHSGSGIQEGARIDSTNNTDPELSRLLKEFERTMSAGDFKAAEKVLNEVCVRADAVHNVHAKATALGNLGNLASRMNNHRASLTLFEQSR